MEMTDTENFEAMGGEEAGANPGSPVLCRVIKGFLPLELSPAVDAISRDCRDIHNSPSPRQDRTGMLPSGDARRQKAEALHGLEARGREAQGLAGDPPRVRGGHRRDKRGLRQNPRRRARRKASPLDQARPCATMLQACPPSLGPRLKLRWRSLFRRHPPSPRLDLGAGAGHIPRGLLALFRDERLRPFLKPRLSR